MQLPKACKNPVEIEGTRQAHIRDGAALSKFLCWLAREAPQRNLTEIDAAKTLEGFRAQTGALRDLSFDSISGAGPNGAVVHYRVTDATTLESVFKEIDGDNKTARQVDEKITSTIEEIDAAQKVVLIKVAGTLSSGRRADVDFSKMEALFSPRSQ